MSTLILLRHGKSDWSAEVPPFLSCATALGARLPLATSSAASVTAVSLMLLPSLEPPVSMASPCERRAEPLKAS